MWRESKKSKVEFDSIVFKECIDSKYIKSQRICFVENGKNREWDIVESHDSVSILLYHVELDSLVVVRQFRPSVFIKNRDGYVFELCAGIVDKDGKSLKEIAAEEAEEECGYRVSSDRLELVSTFYTSVGFAGSKKSMYFAKIYNNDKVSEGGGICDENIDVIYIKRGDLLDFLADKDISKTAAISYGIIWFLNNQNSL